MSIVYQIIRIMSKCSQYSVAIGLSGLAAAILPVAATDTSRPFRQQAPPLPLYGDRRCKQQQGMAPPQMRSRKHMPVRGGVPPEQQVEGDGCDTSDDDIPLCVLMQQQDELCENMSLKLWNALQIGDCLRIKITRGHWMLLRVSMTANQTIGCSQLEAEECTSFQPEPVYGPRSVYAYEEVWSMPGWLPHLALPKVAEKHSAFGGQYSMLDRKNSEWYSKTQESIPDVEPLSDDDDAYKQQRSLPKTSRHTPPPRPAGCHTDSNCPKHQFGDRYVDNGDEMYCTLDGDTVKDTARRFELDPQELLHNNKIRYPWLELSECCELEPGTHLVLAPEIQWETTGSEWIGREVYHRCTSSSSNHYFKGKIVAWSAAPTPNDPDFW